MSIIHNPSSVIRYPSSIIHDLPSRLTLRSYRAQRRKELDRLKAMDEDYKQKTLLQYNAEQLAAANEALQRRTDKKRCRRLRKRDKKKAGKAPPSSLAASAPESSESAEEQPALSGTFRDVNKL